MERWYLGYGGGLGDVCYEYATGMRGARTIRSVVESGYTVAVVMTCHHTNDLWKHHPYISEVIDLGWKGGGTSYDPRRLLVHEGRTYYSLRNAPQRFHEDYRPQFYVSAEEQKQMDDLLDAELVVMVQPFAGVRRRDAFNEESLLRFADEFRRVAPGVRLLAVGGGKRADYDRTETLEVEHPNIVNLVGQLSMRQSWIMAGQVHGFVGGHSALIRSAWLEQVPSVCVATESQQQRINGMRWDLNFGLQGPRGIAVAPNETEEFPDHTTTDVQAIIDHLLRLNQ